MNYTSMTTIADIGHFNAVGHLYLPFSISHDLSQNPKYSLWIAAVWTAGDQAPFGQMGFNTT